MKTRIGLIKRIKLNFARKVIIYKLAFKNLTRQKKRNAILAIAIAFGFFVVTAIDGLTAGIVDNLENQIAQLVGGTVLIQGIEKIPPTEEGKKSQLISIIRDGAYIKNLVEESGINYKSVSFYSTNTGRVIFEGNKSVVQLYGRDLSDKDLTDSFQFVSGGIENLKPYSVLISDKTAESLGLEVGDQFIFSTSTVYGQNAVTDLTVAGIFKSNSLINTLQAYTDLAELNTLIGLPEDGYTIFSIYLNNKEEQVKVANLIENKLREDGQNVSSRLQAMMTNPTNIGRGITKQFEGEDNQWEGTKWGVEALYDQIGGIKTVVNVVHVVATVILLVILFIVMVGISNTYRMILYERIREIGTMRALGMEGKTTGKIFTTEAVVLCILGAVLGLLISVVAMTIVHFIPVSNEALRLFLDNGHFTFKLSAVSIIVQYILLIALTSWAVWGSARKAAKMNPAEALRTFK
ncbi:MAG: FtsX-like permease family protein [Treponema sp.]|nr:FtsX-like permease family protein [Treponema sp.]